MATFDIDEFLKVAAQGEAAAAAPSSPTTGGSTPFYKRPITVPAGLKAAGRGALRLLGRASVPTAAAAAVMPGAELLKSLFEAGAGAIAGGPTVEATLERGRSGFGAAPRPAISAPAATSAPAAVPLTEDQRAAALEVGRLQIAREALVQGASPEAGGTGISRFGLGARPRSSAGGFAGALLGLKQKTGAAAQQLSRQKLLQALLLKLPGMQKDVAETQLLGVRGREAERARAGGAGPGEIAAIAAGRAPGEGFTAIPDLTGQFIDVVQTRGPGAGQRATRLKPQQAVTEANIQATMRAQKLSREQVKAAYVAQGYDVTNIR